MPKKPSPPRAVSRPNRPLERRVLSQIERHAFAAVAPSLAGSAHLAIDAVPYPKGHVFRLVDRTIEVRQSAILVFVDDLPGANWAHPCRYRFHDPKSGAFLYEEAASFPPSVSDARTALRWFHAPGATTRAVAPPVVEAVDWRRILHVPVLPGFAQEARHAILFTGQISNTRHVADLEFLWRTLVDVYGFDQNHIYVLCFDGTVNSVDGVASGQGIGKWGGDNTNYRMPVWGAGTKAKLQAAFDAVGKKIGPNDLLLVHTNNHGSTTGLCLDNSTVLTPGQLGDMLAGLPGYDRLVVMMEQCYSGAFSDPVLTKSTASCTVFTSAAPKDEVSWGGSPFDAFAGVWIEALAGAHAGGGALSSDPDVDDNGRVSMREAFDYATANDASGDHPVYADHPTGCGAHVYLGAPRIRDILDILSRYVEAVRVGRIPLPDPPPDVRPGDLEVARQVQIHRQLIGLAKAMGPYASAARL